MSAPHPTLPEYYAHEDARQPFVTELFDRTARYYDGINAAMSFGFGIIYRRQALQRAGLRAGMRLLDVAVGTGLVAHAARSIVGDDRLVTGVDPSGGMLAEARRRVGLTVVQGVAERLPFTAAQFDFVTMGYALRHVAGLDTAFAEYRRVLRPGGRVLILEISRPRSRAALALARWYLRVVLPHAVRVGTGSSDAATLMRYYWDTIATCVSPDEIVAALTRTGFKEVTHNLVAGIFSEYRATTPLD